jgi:hypothetical protein
VKHAIPFPSHNDAIYCSNSINFTFFFVSETAIDGKEKGASTGEEGASTGEEGASTGEEGASTGEIIAGES